MSVTLATRAGNCACHQAVRLACLQLPPAPTPTVNEGMNFLVARTEEIENAHAHVSAASVDVSGRLVASAEQSAAPLTSILRNSPLDEVRLSIVSLTNDEDYSLHPHSLCHRRRSRGFDPDILRHPAKVVS